MLWKIAGWFMGSGFRTLTDIYNKFKDSEVESERIQAQSAKSQLDAMMENRMATSGYMEMRILTAIIGGVFTTHLVLVGLDTCFKWTFDGRPVRAFPAPFDQWEGAILLSFFGLTAAAMTTKAVTSTIRSIFGGK